MDTAERLRAALRLKRELHTAIKNPLRVKQVLDLYMHGFTNRVHPTCIKDAMKQNLLLPINAEDDNIV